MATVPCPFEIFKTPSFRPCPVLFCMLCLIFLLLLALCFFIILVVSAFGRSCLFRTDYLWMLYAITCVVGFRLLFVRLTIFSIILFLFFFVPHLFTTS